VVDLASQSFDAGIRLGQFIAADMIAVRLTPPFPLVLDFNSFPPFRLWRSLQRFELTWVYFCVRIF
jgi:hypothetical protein